MKPSRSTIPLIVTGLFAIGAVVWSVWLSPDEQKKNVPPPKSIESAVKPDRTLPDGDDPFLPRLPLSELADAPNWKTLNKWQSTITRSEFTELLEDVYTVSPAWREWFYIGEKDLLVETGDPRNRFRLRFAEADSKKTNPRNWKTAKELGPAPADLPLDGLNIAIDAGHIGGRWAKIEERWFQIGEAFPVQEGDMTLLVANLLQTKLEELGANVWLVRKETEPVTELRPETLLLEAKESAPSSPQKLAERLFYRTAEIRARAKLVNEEIKPDLVLCLHFNAESWGDPKKPELVKNSHFHILLNGAYTDGEVGLADQRYHMVKKIVQGTHQEEAAVSKSIAKTFAENTSMPPYLYEIASKRAVNVDGNPYLWARNLLANRLYDCPVIFLEPYVMNSIPDYNRIQAGDYEGIRLVDGQPMPSIFREYANCVANGLEDYYRTMRLEDADEE